MSLKYCTGCGSSNASIAKFCTSCGKSLALGVQRNTTSTTSTAKSTTPSFTSIATSSSNHTSNGNNGYSRSTLKQAPKIHSTSAPSLSSNSSSTGGSSLSISKPLPPTPPKPSTLTSNGASSKSTLTIGSKPTTTTGSPLKHTSTTTSNNVTSTGPSSRSYSVSYKSSPLSNTSTSSTTNNNHTTTTNSNRHHTLKPVTVSSLSNNTKTSSTNNGNTESFLNVKLKETKINTNEPTRPKSHTISLVSMDDKPKGSFVKLAAKSRESLDHQAQRDINVLSGVTTTPAPTKSNGHTLPANPKPLPSTKDTLVQHKKSVSTPLPPTPISSTPPEPPKKPAHLSSQNSFNSMENLKKLEKERFEKEKIEQERIEKERQRIEKEKEERERERIRQLERDRKEKVERERQEKEERERLEKEKQAAKEKLKQEKQRDKQMEKEKHKQEKEREKQQKEKEKMEKEREKHERLEQEKWDQERLEKLEKEKLERERLEKERQSFLSGDNTVVSPSNSSSTTSLDDAELSNSPKLSAMEYKNKEMERRRKEREKYNTSPAGGRSRFFSFILGDKEPELDDLVISSPGDNNGNGRPASPQIHALNNTNGSSGSLDEDVDSGSESGSFVNGEGGQRLRKWAIKRNELQKSERDLLAASGSSNTSTASGESPSSRSVTLATNRISHQYEHIATPGSPNTSNASSSSFVLGSSRINGPNPPPQLPPLPQATDHRSKVIEEFIVTEADYIRDLEIMCWLRKELVQQDEQSKTSTIDEINTLFSNCEQLLLVNKTLYTQFCAPPKGSDDFGEAIALALIAMADFLKSYFVYCSNQTKALSTYSGLRGKNCSYLAYLLTRRECRSLPFDSFLIKPVQRVCKYPLLIRELIKSTPTTHKSHPLFVTAQTKIEAIVSTVNDKKREFDSQMRMYDIQNRLTSGGCQESILSPSRRLCREGPIQSMGFTIPGNFNTQYNKKAKDGLFFLFNDLFIYSQPTNKGDLEEMSNQSFPLKLKAFIPLGECIIREVINDPNCFEILYSSQQIWMFVFPNEDEMRSIFEDIDGLIEQIQVDQYKRYAEAKQQEKEERSSSSEVESYDEWKKLVRGKQLPPIPQSASDASVIRFNCHYQDNRMVELPKESPTLQNLKSKIKLKFSLDNLDFHVQPNGGNTLGNDEDLANILRSVKEDTSLELNIKL